MTNAEIHYGIISNRLGSFYDMNILEIGCGAGELTRYLADFSGARFINAIDFDLDIWGVCPSSGQKWEISQGDARSLCFDDDYFDLVISIGVFEHIDGLDEALSEIERVLKPGGKCFAFFEPIFTSIIGHHYNFWIPEDLHMIPPWGHLLMTPKEMHEHICAVRGENTAKKAVEQIYESNIINRYTRNDNDYYRFLSSCGMTVGFLSEMLCVNRVVGETRNEFDKLTWEQKERLLRMYSKTELSVRGFEVVMLKNQNWHI